MGLFRTKSIKKDKERQFRGSQNRLGKSFLDSLEEIRRIPIDAALKLIQKFQSRKIELKKQNEQFRGTRDGLKRLFDRFYELYEFAPVGYFTLDEDGTIFETNLMGADMLGCERAYLIGKELAQFIVPECQAEYLNHFKLSFATKARQTCQLKIERRDGDFFFAHLESIPVKDSQGNYSQIRTAVCDISSRKQIEEALREAHDILVKQVQQHTAELVEANEKLRGEIEDRRHAEKALQESQATIQALIDATPESAMLVDSKGTVLAINEIAAQRLGKSKDGIIGRSAYDDLPPEVARNRAANLKNVMISGEPVCFADERAGRHCYNSLYPVFDPQGNVEKIAIFTQDLTMQHQTELALRESEQRFKSIFENTPVGFYRTTPDGRILDANPALIQMLGYASFKELAAVNLETDAYHPRYPRHQFRERIERDGVIRGMESLWKRPDDTLVYIRENARAIRDADGNIVFYEGTVEDISDQKQSNEQIRSLSQQLIKAQEDERQMISRELHDRVAQDLYTLMIGLNTLFDQHPNVTPEVRKKALELSEMLQGTIRVVRDLSYELRPPGLDDMGLIAALSMYCEEFAEKCGLKADFQATGMSALRLDFDTEMNIYRLIQEGLNNIRKHAAASQATVRLVRAYPNIILRIEDDGKGFDVEERARKADSDKRMGLRSMAERVRLIQGKMTIKSQPMKGTRIFIKFPYQEKKHDS